MHVPTSLATVIMAAVATTGCLSVAAPVDARPTPPPSLAGSPTAGDPTATATATNGQAIARPDIVQRPIPYGAARRAQMADYSRMHYGRAEWRLRPRGVVQHYTATNSLASVFATFRANQPDVELGQLPGVCTHFVIDRDGTVYQLVPLNVRCRHTVGLNHRMLGIEHVGTSDAAVMGNRAQRRASLRLTAWLVDRFALATGDVIGHSENRSSRFHREDYRPWRCQTHGDFSRTTMTDYRSRLNARVARSGADTSPPRWVSNGC